MKKIKTSIYSFIEKPACRYVFYLLMALLPAIFRNMDNQDELWNFNFANCIANGLLPYRDFNLLQTPFSCFLNSIPLSIFGSHLIIIRIMGAFLFTGIAIECDRIIRLLGKKGTLVMIPGCAIICMFFWNIFLEYSGFIMFASLFAMRFDLEVLSGKNKSILSQLVVGIILGLGMLCKQTTGTFMAVCGWIVCGIAIAMSVTEKKTGRVIKGVFLRMLGSSVPCFIFLFYLLGTGTFGDFWDMCYKGIFTFSSSYSYITFMMENAGYFALGAALPILIISGIIISIVCRKQNKGKQAIILVIYSLFACLHMIPLANAYHVAVSFVTVMLILGVVIPEKAAKHLAVRIISGIGLTAMFVFLALINPITDIIDNDWVRDVKGLEGILCPSDKQENLREIIKYVEEKNSEGKTVYILDNFAPAYFMPSGQYHKYLDMFLEGNLGTITPLEVLENTEEGCIFLFPDAERKNYQMPRKVEEEYLSGLTKLGRICDFTIFEK